MRNLSTALLVIAALGLGLIVCLVPDTLAAGAADEFPADYQHAGWRGGIGIAFGQPARKIRDVTELGLDIVWGDEEPLRAAMLDVAVFRYWNCTVELSLKDPDGRFDFSQMENKDEAARLAFDKSAELRYGVQEPFELRQRQVQPRLPVR